MTAYTEADFAATLLECGPHMTDCNECRNSSGVQSCPNIQTYRLRVRDYFYKHIEIFPTSGDSEQMYYDVKEFWKAYVEWVEP